ncbi:hypothetical protein EV143_10585 [Flavobacterium chryseum]|uniref:Imm42 family immunity protein n=1 Tax=Flavobacterium sp. P3160 TaxID=2512113 RepID=UPI00105C65D6|nr:Imm42 family immunity protein [Flavobacterium sp. P3160]TDO73493.1 hypothetical protein EV143_10585 [Flavobacterium sp. P3160]
MIIGNKETFAVELTIDENNPKMGYAKLWLQNIFLGTNEDLIYLNGYLIYLIDELLNSKKINLEVEKLTKIEIFNLLKSSLKKRSDYAIIGSTFTDDFEIYSYSKNDDLFVLWKLNGHNDIIFSDLEKYGNEIQFACISQKEVEQIKEKTLEIIKLSI